VDELNFKLYKLFSLELVDLNIGYSFNSSRISKMMDLVNAIDYIKNGDPSRNDIIKILKRYE
jgi:hypothetical protein